MLAHGLRAPAADGALLADPPIDRAPETLQANRARLESWDHDFQGRRASHLRPRVRAQVFEAAQAFLGAMGIEAPAVVSDENSLDTPLVVTGHQPELFHPGVWVKNFAVAAIARESRGVGLNLIVDNDLPKASSVKVPVVSEAGARVAKVAFDEWPGEVPFEDLRVSDESLFASFADRLRATLSGTVVDPVVDDFWPRALAARSATDRVGLRFAAARRELEASWGVHNLEVPLSAICETEGFLWFVSHLLAHLPRFQEVHNAALERYRVQYHIRSRNHPVPALGSQDGWLEAPFWVWREREPRRRPLLARQAGRTLVLRVAGEAESLLELPLGPDREACCAVEQLATLPRHGVRLRTRALTTTMFSRYLLGDLFLHGIGGAKYDELGDEISKRFFGFAPPAYMTLSMTLWLGIDADPTARDRWKANQWEQRDLTYNPQRHLEVAQLDATARGWLEARQAAILGPVDTHAQRLERFHEIRRCNAALQAVVQARREVLQLDQPRLAAAVERDLRARNREYSLVIHSARRLREVLARSLPALDLHDGSARV